MSAVDLDWMDRAACRRVRGFTELPQAEQRDVCDDCPVRASCTEYGLQLPIPSTSDRNDDTWPLFGGMTPKERAALRRSRQRGALNNTSGYWGVSPTPDGRWRAAITVAGRCIHLGYFTAPEDAAYAYDTAALEHRGVEARLNFPAVAA